MKTDTMKINWMGALLGASLVLLAGMAQAVTCYPPSYTYTPTPATLTLTANCFPAVGETIDVTTEYLWVYSADSTLELTEYAGAIAAVQTNKTFVKTPAAAGYYFISYKNNQDLPTATEANGWSYAKITLPIPTTGCVLKVAGPNCPVGINADACVSLGEAVTLVPFCGNKTLMVSEVDEAGPYFPIPWPLDGIDFPRDFPTYYYLVGNSNNTLTASNKVTVNTLCTVPSAPIIGTATAGASNISVAFTSGSAGSCQASIPRYTVECGLDTNWTSPAGSNTGNLLSIDVSSGLAAGSAYSCRAKENSAGGSSEWSDKSNTATILQAPSAPTIGTASQVAGGGISVGFTPRALGSGTLINYTVECGLGASWATAVGTNTGAASPIVVSGLAYAAHTCKVNTTSSVGPSGWSALSNSISPAAIPPGAPTIGTPEKGNSSVSVNFTAPTNLGNGSLTGTGNGYTASCGAGASWTTAVGTNTGAASPIVVSGLANNTAYTCKVKVKTSTGEATSALSVSVTPGAVPSAPTIGTATAGNGSISVAFTAGGSNGTVVSGYTAECGRGSPWTATSSANGASPITVPGLANGTAYTCRVRANITGGSSVWSGFSNSATPQGQVVPCAQSITTSTQNLYSSGGTTHVTMNTGKAYAFKVTTTNVLKNGQFAFASSTAGNNVVKYVSVSKTLCDFSYTNLDQDTKCASTSMNPVVTYSAGSTVAGSCRLDPISTYYVNVRNENASDKANTKTGEVPRGKETCPVGSACGFVFGLY